MDQHPPTFFARRSAFFMGCVVLGIVIGLVTYTITLSFSSGTSKRSESVEGLLNITPPNGLTDSNVHSTLNDVESFFFVHNTQPN